MSGCATNFYKLEECYEPKLRGNTYGDLYEYAQEAQGALRKCNASIRAVNRD